MSIVFEEMTEAMEVVERKEVNTGDEFGSTFPKVEFNASVVITELLAKTLENCAKELASRCIRDCALRHGFDASEEIRVLGLENLALLRKQMAKKPKGLRSEEKKEKTKGVKKGERKSNFPLPFNPDLADLSKCHGIVYNRGLFTQCSKEQVGGVFCKSCQAECDTSASRIPNCGTLQTRLAAGLYEFKDPNGRSPISYVKVLEKAKLSIPQALDEAGKLNFDIPEEHFVVSEKPKKTAGPKGRPKKITGAIEAADVTDLFSKLTAMSINEEAEAAEPAAKAKKSKLTDEEKETKKAALEADRAAKKLERESKQAEEKEEREAKRKAEIEVKKLEREAKIATEKAERENKRLQEKEEKEAKKAAEKAAKEAEKAAKEAEKASKGSKKETKAAPVVAPAPAPVVAPTPAPAPAPSNKISTTRFQVDGKQYLKSIHNVVYNLAKEEIGIWDPETKTIKLLPEDEEEEAEVSDLSDDEYESDEN